MARITGLGNDLVRSERFRRFLRLGKQTLIDRLFTAGERGYALAKKDPAPHLAVRFAAKEAFLKALGTGLRGGITWQDMAVARDDLGRPDLRLSGAAARLFHDGGHRRLHLTCSHDGDYALATVILEGE
jgi:holo-[acyl-carrier protein] synthase